LLEGEKNVSDIALELGFAEPSAFYRAFRKWTSKSPRAFQRDAGRTQ
jgi:AraC-like DNA-binding protein